MKERMMKLLLELLKDSKRSDREIAKVLGVSQPAITILREIMSLEEQSKETIEHRIKNELHPCLSSLIKELIKEDRQKKTDKRIWAKDWCNLPCLAQLYETKNDDYFIRANEPKLLKWHSSNGCVYEDTVDVDVETFLEEEIKTPDNVLRLLRRIAKLESHPKKMKKLDWHPPWLGITRRH